MKKRLLVVDDEAQMRKALDAALGRKGYEVETAPDAKAALVLLKGASFNAVISDVKMPGMTGVEFLRSIKAIKPEMPVVMMTAYGTIESAIEAMKEGASDYILKPSGIQLKESLIKWFACHCERSAAISSLIESSTYDCRVASLFEVTSEI